MPHAYRDTMGEPTVNGDKTSKTLDVSERVDQMRETSILVGASLCKADSLQ